MRSKYKVYLTEKVYAVLSLDLSLTREQEDLAESQGIGKEEQSNLIGQKLQELLYLLGNTDEA